MNYTDLLFLALFAVLWLICRLLNRQGALREWVVIAFGLTVLASWGAYSLLVLLVVALVNFVAVAAAQSSPHRQAIIGAAIVFDVAALAYFKYWSFIPGLFGIFAAPSLYPIILPLAISFYTFHLISYLVDSQRRKLAPLPLRK